jgi:uncharacterized tellurite resistance protein B-like protein
MFVDAMTTAEKYALLGALGYMAGVDGELTAEEVSLIEVMATVLGIDARTVLVGEPRPLEEILAPIVDAKHQRAVLIELLRMAYVDQRFTAEEVATVDRVAEIFAIRGPALVAFKEWVEQELACKRLAEELIDAEV